MSDVMLFGVLQMPYDMAMGDELSRHQFYSYAQQALAKIEELRRDAERYRFLICKGRVPIRCSGGYYYEDGVMHATPEEAIDAARGAEG